MRENEFLDNILLKVSEGLDLCRNGSTAFSDGFDVIGGRNGTSATGIDEFNATAFDLANNSILSDTDVRAIDNEAVY